MTMKERIRERKKETYTNNAKARVITEARASLRNHMHEVWRRMHIVGLVNPTDSMHCESSVTAAFDISVLFLYVVD
jgi:hypothetical protein